MAHGHHDPHISRKLAQHAHRGRLDPAGDLVVDCHAVSAGPLVEREAANHTNVQPAFDVYANVQSRDLGSVAAEINQLLAEYRAKLTPGNTIVMRGQVESMESAFFRLGLGLVFAAVLVYLLMVVNFQSWLDPF
ncbi:MAG: efflux RND transporter permease subunit, partial [Pirellulales bacterium]